MIKEKESAFWGPLPPHTSLTGVFLLTGRHILNHQLFSPRQAAFIRPLAHAVNNFHTPFSLHLIKRDLRFTTLPSRKGDMSVNGNASLIYSWEKGLHFSPSKTTPLLTVKCLPSQSIKMHYYKRHFGMLLRNGSLIAMGVRAEDQPVILNGVLSIT